MAHALSCILPQYISYTVLPLTADKSFTIISNSQQIEAGISDAADQNK